MLRIVHTADCHLDAPCASLDAGVRARVRAAEREAFARVCTLAIEREAHALVIAGDVFERSEVGPAALHHVLAQLARVTEAGHRRRHRQRQPRPRPARSLPLDQARLHARAHPRAGRRADRRRRRRRRSATSSRSATPARPRARISRSCCPPRRARVSVAVLHAQVDGAAGARERYAPCAPEDLDRGYAYWALGHVHLRQELRTAPPAWYPGCLMPHDVGEPGAKGALVVEIDAGGRAEVEFVPLAPLRFERLRLDDVTGAPALAGPDRRGDGRARGDAARRPRRGARRARRAARSLAARGRAARPRGAQPPAPRISRSRSARSAPSCAASTCARRSSLDKHRGQPHLLGAALEIAVAPPPSSALLDELAPASARGRALRRPPRRRAYMAELLGRARRDARRGAAGGVGTVKIDRLRVGAYGALAELELEGLAESDIVVDLRPQRGRQVEPPLVRRRDALRLLARRARGSPRHAARRARPRRARARAAERRARARRASSARPAERPGLARRRAGGAREPPARRRRLARARHLPRAPRLRRRRAARARRRDLARDRAAPARRRLARLPAAGRDRRTGAVHRRRRPVALRSPRQAALGGAAQPA